MVLDYLLGMNVAEILAANMIQNRNTLHSGKIAIGNSVAA